jgi:type III pantothenate kinase
MLNLVLDIGNTFSKIAVFKNKEIIFFERLKGVDEAYINQLIDKYEIENSTISTVNNDIESLEQLLRARTNYKRFNTKVTGKVLNHYETPDTLGLDRWAKVIAAHCLYAGRNSLMIDAGTCITYDLLKDNNEYSGGSISLGLNMRFKALNHFTERLPLVNWDGELAEIAEGTNTQNAIRRGVLQGAVNEIIGFIDLESKRNKDLRVILTGGDAVFLNKQLKNSIFASQIQHEPYLVLKGLNEVITL